MALQPAPACREAAICAQLTFLIRYARTFPPLDPDDLVQDTVCRALKKWDLRRDGTKDRAWLGTMMHNLAMNTIRNNREDACDFVADLLPPQEPRQLDYIHAREALRRIEDLPELQADVLREAMSGATYSEISDSLGIPMGTVMSRLYRAREKIAGKGAT